MLELLAISKFARSDGPKLNQHLVMVAAACQHHPVFHGCCPVVGSALWPPHSANTRHWTYSVLMLYYRQHRWPNIKPCLTGIARSCCPPARTHTTCVYKLAGRSAVVFNGSHILAGRHVGFRVLLSVSSARLGHTCGIPMKTGVWYVMPQ